MNAAEGIERGLALFAELLGEDPQLAGELRESRALFASAGAPTATPERELADRRHLEWFLFERPSEGLEGVPVEALQPAWRSRSGAELAPFAEAFLSSLAGVFEVTGVDAGRGLWLRDLAGLGEYPVQEPEAASAIESGDLVVGRMHPVQEGEFRLSPAAALFRDPALAEALRGDLERMRASRRGSLRIEQLELERLFFGAPRTPARATAHAGAPVGSSAILDGALTGAAGRATREAREALAREGLRPADADRLIEALERAARSREGARAEGDVVTEALNRLAFHTSVDLERARRILLDLWSVLVGRAGAGATVLGAKSAKAAAARAALEEFDRGRREGQDLEDLFRRLEADLGVDALPEEDDDEPAPDFPGVVGAMVEEFLWDTAREEGADAARRLSGLRRLARYGADIGVFENLGPHDLLDFAGRWVLDEREVRAAEEARELLDALAAFCRWCEERHALPLWNGFGRTLESLRGSLPRLAELVVALEPPALEEDEPYEVARVEPPDQAVVVDRHGEERRTDLDGTLARGLRPGDLLRARPADGRLAISACYPPELGSLRER
jgi:hypothetical protein